MRPHFLEGLNRRLVDGVRRRSGRAGGRGLRVRTRRRKRHRQQAEPRILRTMVFSLVEDNTRRSITRGDLAATGPSLLPPAKPSYVVLS